jgi:CheY-like chemotaxis protein
MVGSRRVGLKMKPDVAIVDYSMPVMNGLEVTVELNCIACTQKFYSHNA